MTDRRVALVSRTAGRTDSHHSRRAYSTGSRPDDSTAIAGGAAGDVHAPAPPRADGG
ncbi:hypothetical protein [Streptomyces sp. NPDC057426]|uniref:hypothetical protein n=1 Tax=Streptomyces sp. NPDC057426 TaxID=3346128 RepID=UPI003696361C